MTTSTTRLPLTNSEIAEILEECKQYLHGHEKQDAKAIGYSHYICNAIKLACHNKDDAKAVTAAVRYIIAEALASSSGLIGKYWSMLDAYGTAVDDPDYQLFRDLWLDAVIADLLASPDEVQDATVRTV